jgi:RsiW-degrading membrane proteinase PrsW (M82 family)
MLQDSVSLLKSFFVYPGLTWNYMLIGIALGIAFGAVWLWAHSPPLFKKPWLWAVAVGSAFLTLIAVAFIQVPLQDWVGQALNHLFSQDTLLTWLLLAMVPGMLLTGLVQEGTKMVPIVVWWRRSGKKIEPKLGLAIGAIAGAGFGIFEAVWVHNRIFAAGWTMQALQTDGFMAVAGFWERFFIVGFHIAISALVGYGLAKGKGWQFYLIAAGLHLLLNFGSVVREYIYYKHGFDALVQIEVFVAVMAVAVTVWALMLRWGKTEEVLTETAAPTETGLPTEIGTPTEGSEPPRTDVQP